ncbi:MAG: lipopolysaccharide heptosyltransferase II [Elusimicrobia bacterium]|nr:lipopolysaccharide heptosyltransferase II [Elusimicrobiota bacterium]
MKILIIQTAFLGDVVLTIPLIQAARKYLKARISVVCIPSTANILEGHPDIDEIIVYDKKGKNKGFLNLLKLARFLKSKKFDTALIPHPSFKSGFLAFLSGIKKRIGFDNSAGRFFFTDTVFFNKSKHQIERYLDLLLYFDVVVREERTRIYVDNESGKYAKILLGTDSNFFGINPGSVWATKRWLPERYAQLSDSIIERLGGKIVIFGGKEDKITADIVEKNMKGKALNLAGKTTLKQLAALIKQCRVFITNDSGPMHIAAAFDVPTIAIFGPTIKEQGFYPYSREAMVIEKDIPCRPCGKHGPKKCPKNSFVCMGDIGVEEVLNAVIRMNA